MCHQSVGLIQRILEEAGIVTVSLSLLHEITVKTQPPRALFVDAPLGYTLGEANNSELQTQILRAAFALLPLTDIPLIVSFSWPHELKR